MTRCLPTGKREKERERKQGLNYLNEPARVGCYKGGEGFPDILEGGGGRGEGKKPPARERKGGGNKGKLLFLKGKKGEEGGDVPFRTERASHRTASTPEGKGGHPPGKKKKTNQRSDANKKGLPKKGRPRVPGGELQRKKKKSESRRGGQSRSTGKGEKGKGGKAGHV